MNFKNVTVAGSGVLGYQIAFQTAFHGFNVTVYDINDEVLEKAKTKFQILSEAFKKDLGATQEQLDATKSRLSYHSDLAEAVKDADLLIEAVPENPQIKIDFYQELAKVAPEKTRLHSCQVNLPSLLEDRKNLLPCILRMKSGNTIPEK